MDVVVAENTSGSGTWLSSTGINAYKQLRVARKSVCMVYDVPFQSRLETLEQSNEDRTEGVHAVISEPLYSARVITEPSNSEPDRLGLQDMSYIGELRPALMDLSGHWHMFCSALEIRAWNGLLVGEAEKVGKHETVLIPKSELLRQHRFLKWWQKR